MTPDEIIAEIFRLQNDWAPDADPGDLTIDVQDDMPLVIVHQVGWNIIDQGYLGLGASLQEALEKALENVRARVV